MAFGRALLTPPWPRTLLLGEDAWRKAMSHENIVQGTSAPRPKIAAPVYPSTPNEFITVLAHYHRAEIARMAGWRDRIDRTTNWAITVVAAMLSVSVSTSNAHHSVLMFAMVLAFF